MKLLHILKRKTPGRVVKASRLYLKLRSRLTLYFLLLVFLPYTVIFTAMYFHNRILSGEKSYDAAIMSLSVEKNITDYYVEELKLSVNKLVTELEAAIYESIDKRRNDYEKDESYVILSSNLRNVIEKELAPTQKQSLSAIYLIDGAKKTALYGEGSDTSIVGNLSTQQWYYDAIRHPDEVQLLGTEHRFYYENKNKVVLGMAKALPSYYESSKAVLLFDFNFNFLSIPYNNLSGDLRNAYEKLIIDFEGNILWGSQNPDSIAIKADKAVVSAAGGVDSSFTRIKYKEKPFYMTSSRYPKLNWTFIELIPQSDVSAPFRPGDPFMIFLVFLLPVLLIIFIIVSLRLLLPINELTNVITDYESKLPGIGGQTPILIDENQLKEAGRVSDVDYFINKIYSINLKQKEAELNSLQNQINPHFLYNTLESIRGAALYHGIQEIAAMSRALSLFFRYSINSHALVSIKEELQHLENYMEIQNFRFENKFELQCNIPQEFMNNKILKLTLQPLIENSIKHGLEMKLGKGTIKISVAINDNNIKLQISDDGLGMSAKKINELNWALTCDNIHPSNAGDKPGTGIGVRNVNSRIKLYFGNQYGLKFKETNTGTTVEITLPAIAGN